MTNAIRTWLEPEVEGDVRAYVVGGDFNVHAGQKDGVSPMNNLYRLQLNAANNNGAGDFVEGDQFDTGFFGVSFRPPGVTCTASRCRSGDFTGGFGQPPPCLPSGGEPRKIDYLFYSLPRTQTSGLTLNAVERACEGGLGHKHRLLKARGFVSLDL